MRIVTVLIITLAVLAIPLLWYFENYYFLTDARTFHTWLQLISGRWPELEHFTLGVLVNRRSWGFATVVWFRIVVLIAPTVGVIVLVYKLWAWERRLKMQLAQALALRDHLIKGQILDKLPPTASGEDTERALDEAFAAGEKHWERELLPKLLGRKKAASLVEKIKEEQV